VAQAGDGCATAGVEIALTIPIDDIRPVAADCNRIIVFWIALKNLANGDLSLRGCFGMTETTSDLGEYEETYPLIL
jgi:AMMECR1 domain-containing protein